MANLLVELRGNRRPYRHPVTGNPLPSVTTILGMLNKPGLLNYVARQVASYAVDNRAWLTQLANNDPAAAVAELAAAADRRTHQAAVRGTRVHALTEALACGRSPGNVPSHLHPYLHAYQAFVRDFAPEFVAVETTVVSSEHGYVGIFDWLARIEGLLILGDAKTNAKAVHREAALQVAALARADHLVLADGTLEPMPQVDLGAVLHLSPQLPPPGYRLHPVNVRDDRLLAAFLGLRAAWEFTQQGQAVHPPVATAAALVAHKERLERAA